MQPFGKWTSRNTRLVETVHAASLRTRRTPASHQQVGYLCHGEDTMACADTLTVWNQTATYLRQSQSSDHQNTVMCTRDKDIGGPQAVRARPAGETQNASRYNAVQREYCHSSQHITGLSW